MADSYYTHLAKIDSDLKQLTRDIEERNKLASTQANSAKVCITFPLKISSFCQKDIAIRAQAKELEKRIATLLDEVQKYEKEQDQYHL